MGDLEDATKGILQVAPADVLRLAFGGSVTRVRERNPVRVSNTRLRDGLFDAVLDGERTVAHLEVEATPMKRTPRRVVDYWHQLVFALGRDVRIAVLYLERGRWRGAVPSCARTRGPDGTLVRIGFHAVPVWELDAEACLRRGLAGALPYVALMRGAEPPLIARAIERLGRLRAPLRVRADLQVATAMVAGRAFPAVDWMGTLSEETKMNSPAYEQIVQSGRDQGLEAMRQSIVDVVRSHHGRAPRRLAPLLSDVHDFDVLRKMLVAVVRADSAEDAVTVVERSIPRRRSSAASARAGTTGGGRRRR